MLRKNVFIIYSSIAANPPILREVSARDKLLYEASRRMQDAVSFLPDNEVIQI
jgi:hypothetical protein